MKPARWNRPHREQLAISTMRAGAYFGVLGVCAIGLDWPIAGAGVLTCILSVLMVFGIALYDEFGPG